MASYHADSPSSCHFTVELAMIMDRLYGGVCYAGIDVDPELKYPKGKHLGTSPRDEVCWIKIF